MKVKHSTQLKGARLLNAVADAAVAWWVERRPIGWSLELHLKHPRVNTTSPAQERLAEAAARLCEFDPVARADREVERG